MDKLQVQNQEYRIKEYKLVPYDQKNNVITTFDNWVKIIHQSIPFDLARKDVLWREIQSTPAMLYEMPEVGPYMYSDDHSFIRFVFECRKRLIKYSKEEDIN